jgi:hypothetical protein
MIFAPTRMEMNNSVRMIALLILGRNSLLKVSIFWKQIYYIRLKGCFLTLF